MNKKLSTAVIGGAVLALGAGSIVLPSAYAASSPASTTINATIGSVISISTSGTVTLNVTPTASGSATSASDAVSVSTNNTLGYKLQLSSSSAATTLTSGGNNIAATTGSFATPAAMTINSWGYRVDGVGTFGAGPTTPQTNVASLGGTWAGVPANASPNTLKTTGSTATNDATTVWYGTFVDSSKPNGTYTGTVTYTASTN